MPVTSIIRTCSPFSSAVFEYTGTSYSTAPVNADTCVYPLVYAPSKVNPSIVSSAYTPGSIWTALSTSTLNTYTAVPVKLNETHGAAPCPRYAASCHVPPNRALVSSPDGPTAQDASAGALAQADQPGE